MVFLVPLLATPPNTHAALALMLKLFAGQFEALQHGASVEIVCLITVVEPKHLEVGGNSSSCNLLALVEALNC